MPQMHPTGVSPPRATSCSRNPTTCLLHLFHLLTTPPWGGTVLFFAATLGVSMRSLRFAQFGSVKCTAQALGVTYRSETRLGRQCRKRWLPHRCPQVLCQRLLHDALHQFHRKRQVPRQIVSLFRGLLALLTLVRRIVLTLNILEIVKSHHPRAVGRPRSHSLRIRKVTPCNERVHPECSTSRCTFHCASPHCLFHAAPNGIGNPLSARPATPSQTLNFCVGTFIARRLWLSDHSVLDGLNMLVNLLTDENVEVLCFPRGFLRMSSRASTPSNLSHMMAPPVFAGTQRVSRSEVVCQDSPFMASRMHCPCARTQCASVRERHVRATSNLP